MPKPNFYKLLSNYLKKLIKHPDQITITEQELNKQVDYFYYEKFIVFMTEHFTEMGYTVTLNNRSYLISKVGDLDDDHWE
jgi:hypothetical protein